MTDLERARTHLRVCQESLREWRTAGFANDYYRANIEEDNFLAALSWLWEEQERARREHLGFLGDDFPFIRIEGCYP